MNLTVTKNVRQFAAESWLVQPMTDGGQLYGMDIHEEMNKGMKAQMLRVRELMNYYQTGNSDAGRAVEAFVSGRRGFNNPGHITSRKDRQLAAEVSKIIDRVKNFNNGRTGYDVLPSQMVAEYVHSMSDFRYLLLACVKYQMEEIRSTMECRSTCLDDIFYDIGSVDYCDDRSGVFDIVPVGSGQNAGCKHGAGCNCGGGEYQFAEVARDRMWDAGVYVDHFHWSWDLRQCEQNGGLANKVIMKMLEIGEERRLAKQAALLGTDSGINSAIFNATNENIIIGANGNCHPEVCDSTSAYYTLQNATNQLANHTDSFGRYICPTEYRIVTPSHQLSCYFKQAMDLTITEKRDVTDAETGACIQSIESTSGANCTIDYGVCYDPVLREAMEGDPNIDTTFFIVPVGNERQHVFERGAIEGFENTVIARKRAMWESLDGGRPLNNFGSDNCWNETLMFARGFGVGVDDPKLALASNGTNQPC